jgi:hypothetical protein
MSKILKDSSYLFCMMLLESFSLATGKEKQPITDSNGLDYNLGLAKAKK